MSPLKQKIHKSLSCIFDQLPADGNPGFIVQDKQGSIKINSMIQIDHNASAAKIKSWIHFQGCSKGFEGLAGDQFFAASGLVKRMSWIRPSRTMRKNFSFTGKYKKETNIKKEQKTCLKK